MADPIVTPGADNASTVTTLEQLAAIVAALQGSVQTLTSQAGATQAFQTQVADGLKSLTENVNKLAVSSATDSDSGYLVRSSVDPATSQRNMERYGEIAMANALDFQKGCDAIMIRKLSQDSDHHSALPPLAPRSASGPGTVAS
jgi:hypothetical protein